MASETDALSTLEVALKELGMLSSADNRKDLIREKFRRQQSVSDTTTRIWTVNSVPRGVRGIGHGLASGEASQRESCGVLQMNTQYVTGVVLGGDESRLQFCPFRWAKWPSGDGGSGGNGGSVTCRQRPHHHLKPYFIPWRREERVRTRSENCDDDVGCSSDGNVGVVSGTNSQEKGEVGGSGGVVVSAAGGAGGGGGLFRSRSLEDLRLGGTEVEQCMARPFSQVHEVETVSQQIQRLHVH